MRDPRLVAYDAVNEMVAEGLKKHVREGWRTEPKQMHLIKAINHLVTELRVLEGYSEPDGENHAKNALCRAAFYLSQEKL